MTSRCTLGRWRPNPRFVLTVALCAWSPVAPLLAQAPRTVTGGATGLAQPAPSDDALFAAATQAVAAGKADELLAAADAVLAKSPADRRAAASKVAVLLARGDAGLALDTYTMWASAARGEDQALLVRVARGVLTELESAQLAEIRGRALEARARRGDAAARKTLDTRRAARPETSDTWEATLALARLGDTAAANEVAQAVKESVGSRKAAALGVLRGVPTTPAVIDAIADALATGDDVVRDAAAEAAIDRDAPALVAPLKKVLATARFTAPLRAAVALARMGDPSGQALIEANLGGDLPDGRIVAARAYVGRPAAAWAAKLAPVLTDANPLMRILAAELLLPVRQREAMAALGPELEEENPVLRAEAMRVLAASPAAPLTLLRASLGDRAPWVRFHAADALARRSTDAPRPPAAAGPRRPR